MDSFWEFGQVFSAESFWRNLTEVPVEKGNFTFSLHDDLLFALNSVSTVLESSTTSCIQYDIRVKLCIIKIRITIINQYHLLEYLKGCKKTLRSTCMTTLLKIYVLDNIFHFFDQTIQN